MAIETAEARGLWPKEHVMELLACSEPTLYRLTARAEDPLPALKIGALLRFDPHEVRAWLDRQRKGGHAA